MVCTQYNAGIVRGESASKQDWKRPRLLSAEEIIKVVSIEMDIEVSSIRGKSRVKATVEARHLAIHFTKKKTTLTLSRIGRMFDRDHTTILAAMKHVQAIYDTEQPYRIKYHTIEWLLDKAARL